MDRAHQLANRLLETDDQEFDDAVNVGNFPLQRLLRGNGFKPLPDGHPSHRNSEECWEKQLQNGGVCRVFPMDSEREFQGRREKLWRWEKYSGP